MRASARCRAEKPRHRREIVVIDNGSHDGSPAALREVDGIELTCNPENRGYAGGNNQGAALAQGRFVCLLNSDTEVRPGALDALVDYLLEHRDYGGVAPKLVNLDGSGADCVQAVPGARGRDVLRHRVRQVLAGLARG